MSWRRGAAAAGPRSWRATDETFGRPADIAFGPNDELYVADGYGNSRVVKYDSKGNLVKTWGTPGSAPGDVENITYDTLAGRIMRVDIDTGEIIGAMESPGHWYRCRRLRRHLHRQPHRNVFPWYRDWLETEEAARAGRPEGALIRGGRTNPGGSSSHRTLQVSATLRYPPAAASSVVADSA